MWQLAQAKNRFSEVFTKAMTEGPQTITRRGEQAVLISRAEYDRLSTPGPKKMSLGEFLLGGPSLEGVDLERRKSPMRPVDLE
ncbi:MAG TPA: type II toxin-antitoxin system Phd/YefM family antitoxin [Amaricoccus sp.]|jgi:prevent-host-death family protein|nr:type II toxin-antitoxin system Phd/YefM family antitoxin [Amaricoccus sp.]